MGAGDAMAVWQSDFYLISGLENLPDMTLDGWLPPVLERSRILRVQQVISGYFGPSWPVAEDWFVFGPENGNRIDVISWTHRGRTSWRDSIEETIAFSSTDWSVG